MGRGYGGGERGKLYSYRHTLTTRMTPALKMGSDESHFHFSLTVRDKVTRQCPVSTDYNFLKSLERRAAEAESNRGPSAHQPQALPLGQNRLTHAASMDEVLLSVLRCQLTY